MMRKLIYLVLIPVLLTGCSGRNNHSDAYGNFESVEYLIPAECQGKIMEFSVREGERLAAGKVLGYIDTVPLLLQREQLLAKAEAIRSQKEGISARIKVQETRKKNLLTEKERLEKLFNDNAATGKQMDDLEGQLEIVDDEIAATRSNYLTIEKEARTVEAQINTLDDQIRRSIITNPVKGTVLETYTEPFEMAVPGKALYKIADLDSMVLRVYISGSQLSGIRTGQKVRVIIDDPGQPELEGVVTWISNKSEFTPKIIQTREERVNLVYAVKVGVANDGRLKIGMPGEIVFSPQKHQSQ